MQPIFSTYCPVFLWFNYTKKIYEMREKENYSGKETLPEKRAIIDIKS